MPNNQIQSLTVDGTTYDIVDKTSGYITADSPALTGTPTAPTPLSGADDTQIATVKYVQDAMAGAGAGTVTSVGVANATDGGLSVSGSPITGSGTISIGHSNVLASAQTTSGIYPIKIDKNGHISEYGSAVSIPTNTSDLNNDSHFVSQIDLAENLVSTLYCLNVSGSTASLIDANASAVGIFALSLAFRSVQGVQVAQVLNISGDLAEARMYEIVDADTINRTVRLVAVEGSTVYIADLTDAGSGLTGTISTTTMLTSETDPTVPSWAKAASKPTYTASEVGALASNTTYVSKITTTAGTHSTISSQSGAVSFNVPTKTSHLTNDSGFVTTDEKVKVTALNSSNTYYPILASGIGTDARQIATTGVSFKDSGGGSTLSLGLDSYHWGVLKIGGESAYSVAISNMDITADRSITLPDKSGTVALTSDIPTTYVSKITTTAGAHTAISNQSGAISFNVPTKTSHLTNDSGYINSSASTPTANTVAKFDSSAHMNSTDMTSTEVNNFVSGLDISTTSDVFMVTRESSDSISTATNTNGYVTFTVTNSGYYPLGIVGYELEWFAGQTALINIYTQKLVSATNGSGTIECNFRNMHTATTQWKFKPYVLWVRA